MNTTTINYCMHETVVTNLLLGTLRRWRNVRTSRYSPAYWSPFTKTIAIKKACWHKFYLIWPIKFFKNAFIFTTIFRVKRLLERKLQTWFSIWKNNSRSVILFLFWKIYRREKSMKGNKYMKLPHHHFPLRWRRLEWIN